MPEKEPRDISDLRYPEELTTELIPITGITYWKEDNKGFIFVAGVSQSLTAAEYDILNSLATSLLRQRQIDPQSTKSQRISITQIAETYVLKEKSVYDRFYSLRQKVEKDLPKGMHRLVFCRDEESLLMTEQPHPEDLIREESLKSVAGLTYGRREDGRPVLVREDTLVMLDPELYKMLEILGDRFDHELGYNIPISYEEMSDLLNVRVENMKQLNSKLRKILSEGLEPNHHRLIKTPAGLFLVDPPIENYAKPGPPSKLQ